MISSQRYLTAVPGTLAGRLLMPTPLIIRHTTAHLGQPLTSQPEIFILPMRLILLPLARMMIFGRLVYSGGAWSAKTNVLTNDTKGITGAKIARDENNGNIYALYSARTGSSTATTGNVYYKKSTDGMASWGAETGPINTSADDIYGARVNMMSTERIYVTWYGATPDDLFWRYDCGYIPTRAARTRTY